MYRETLSLGWIGDAYSKIFQFVENDKNKILKNARNIVGVHIFKNVVLEENLFLLSFKYNVSLSVSNGE